ncbi:MAG: TetR/AcrR family transcriptional regulator [Pseudomonadota bacterium]
MAQDQQGRDTYHHGNLPEALVREGARLLAEAGAEGFSLRKLAERTGVTVAAPSHHFGSAKGLLTAIATRGFEKLDHQMDVAASSANSPSDAVIAMCIAYLRMRTTHPGYADVMFQLNLLDARDERFRASAFRAFGKLETALAAALPTSLAADQIALKAKAIWAATHGLSVLPMIDGPESERIIEAVVAAQLGGSP